MIASSKKLHDIMWVQYSETCVSAIPQTCIRSPPL